MLRALQSRHTTALEKPLTFQRRTSAAISLVERLELQRLLAQHQGCVNTVSFTPDGRQLISGSDDRQIVFWDWERGARFGVVRLTYESGHRGNVFQARVLPHTNDSIVVSCAADGQVRVGHIGPSGQVETDRLARHETRAHKLALIPGEPTGFFSCGEDGVVMRLDVRCQRAVSATHLLTCCRPRTTSLRREVALNSIHCNPARPWQFVLGGSDEIVRVYDQRRLVTSRTEAGHRRLSDLSIAQPARRLVPKALRATDEARRYHCTCAVFSHTGEVLASYNDADIYLFSEEGSRPAQAAADAPAQPSTRTRPDACAAADSLQPPSPPLGDPPSSTSARPTPSTSLHEARMHQDAPSRSLPDDPHRAVGQPQSAADVSMPDQPSTLQHQASLQRQQALQEYVNGPAGSSSSSVPQGRSWRRASAPRGRPPLPHAAEASGSSSEPDSDQASDADDDFDAFEPGDDGVQQCFTGHRNNRTVKGVSFMGTSDEFIASGSDDGHVYIWSRDGVLRQWLQGDRHVVNCIEPHPTLPHVLATSGIDHDVKIWSPTAFERRLPGADAQQTMARNRRAQGNASLVISPFILARLIGMSPPRFWRTRESAANQAADADQEQAAVSFAIQSDSSDSEN